MPYSHHERLTNSTFFSAESSSCRFYCATLLRQQNNLFAPENIQSPEYILQTKTGVNADWQPNGIPLPYDEACAKTERLLKIGFSATRITINRKEREAFNTMVDAIQTTGMPRIVFVAHQDFISDELYGKFIGNYWVIANRLQELENYFTYPDNQKDARAQADYQYLLAEHDSIKTDLALQFAQEFASTIQQLQATLKNSTMPITIELWNEPNGPHGEKGEIPRLRPDCYAEIIKHTDQVLQKNNFDNIQLLLGSVFGPPPQVSPYDSSPDYLEAVLQQS